MPQNFMDLNPEVVYTGRGRDILTKFVLPSLQLAISYDRVTSYFTLGSLLAVSQGIDQLYRRGGTMRLVVGLHDIPHELVEAAARDSGILQAEIERVRSNILREATSIQDELTANRLAALAWMMCDGLLRVKLAWLPECTGNAGGIFHSKSYVFRDQEGNILAAIGSQNETVMGLGDNWEKLAVFASWKESREHALSEQNGFEQLWDGDMPELFTQLLDEEFARDLLKALQIDVDKRTGKRTERVLERMLRRTAKLPAFFTLAGPAALFPHQERAHIDALSRWPIRVMLADEVGLGKTFEAGSVIRYCIENCNIGRILILAPKVVLNQWQEELYEHFNLAFWRYESATKCFISPTDEVQPASNTQSILADSSPSLLLVSSQLARGDRGRKDIFASASVFPDMVVVDEAHAARLTTDASGRAQSSRLLRALRDSMSEHVPHLILVTATPLQLDWREYHALLNLIGLPPLWRDPAMYWESLSALANTSVRSLQAAFNCAQLIKEAVSWYKLDHNRFSEEDRSLLDAILEEDASSRVALRAQSNWDCLMRLLARAHPGALLTVRNTRSALIALGYKFPQRQLHGPEMETTDALQLLYEGIEVYLAESYYSIERALYPNKRFSPGFVRTQYQQRLASTLTACKLTLTRRMNRAAHIIRGIDSGSDSDFENVEIAYGDTLIDELEVAPDIGAMAKRAAQIEQGDIMGLLDLCDRALESGDPKIKALLKILEQSIENDRVLVFSQFTESLHACIDAYRENLDAPHACFTGDESWIDIGDGPTPCTRGTIRKYLSEGRIKVVFCSEAASEGINLQAARVLVNVDVPWNPARLEQRIGRIARIGQTADTVDIHSLWYPGSVEGRIYGRLIMRRELFELAVGEFPEIIAKAISEQCTNSTAPAWSEALRKLNALRHDEQLLAMQKVWRFDSIGGSRSEAIRKQLLMFQVNYYDDMGLEPGDLPRTYIAGNENVISLVHPSILALTTGFTYDNASLGELGFLRAGSLDLGLAIKRQGSLWLLRPEDFPNLLEALVLGQPLSLSDHAIQIEEHDLGAMELSKFTSWSPKHTALRFSDITLSSPIPVDASNFSTFDGLKVPVTF